MKIGFDAKRAFHNTTGLGNYSRTLIHNLANLYPQHSYYLFNPKKGKFPAPPENNVREINPGDFISRRLPSAWRTLWLIKDLKKLGIELYHGLSHELPSGIDRSGVASVVTMHDLIFELFPEQFSPVDRRIYHAKFLHACRKADRVIAISRATRDDVVRYYGIDASKIDICYQGCQESFGHPLSPGELESIRLKYNLPDEYFLSVGSIIERKNLLRVCGALKLLKERLHIPLVVVGDGRKYKMQVKRFIADSGLQQRVIFLSEHPGVHQGSLNSGPDLPAIYQMAKALVYPSVYEGFGIPVLEALMSRIPVLTSRISSLPEAGGPGAVCIDPYSEREIADAMVYIHENTAEMQERIRMGLEHAAGFSAEKTTLAVMDVYRKLIS